MMIIIMLLITFVLFHSCCLKQTYISIMFISRNKFRETFTIMKDFEKKKKKEMRHKEHFVFPFKVKKSYLKTHYVTLRF